MINNYSQLPICKYDAISKVLSSDVSDSEKDVKILSILSDIPEKDILSLSVDKVISLQSQASFLSEKPNCILPKNIEYDGFSFSTNFSEMCWGAYIDFQNGFNSYTELLSIILVPEGHKYNDGYSVDFSNLPSDISITVIRSFLNSLTTRVSRSLRYSEVIARLMRKRDLTAFLRNTRSFILQLPFVVL